MTTATPNTISPEAFDPSPVVAGLRQVFESGLTGSRAWRIRQLQGIERFCVEEEGAIATALAKDLGKPALGAFASEIVFVKNEATHARKKLKSWMAPTKVATPITVQPASSYIVHEPLGVVLIISPWNYPFQLLLSPLVAALAAGNCALLKPSEVAPHTARLVAERLAKYVDAGAVRVLEGGVEETTAILKERYDHIFYTGNGTVGRIVMRAAAEHLTPVTLELGGKSPCIVHKSADLDVAAKRIVWGKFFNAGQTCVAPDYILVDESVHDALLNRLVATVREYFGDDPKKSPDFERIINTRHHDRLTALLEGQTLATGGDHDRDSRYIAPTILRDVNEESAVMRDEIFGPILPVIGVRDTDEAVAFVKRGDKPLALYIFAGDKRVQEDVIARTSSGGCAVNHVLVHLAVPELPFGGVGESGMGSYHGKWGFDTFSHRKSVLNASTKIDSAQLLYPPMSGLKEGIARKVL